MKKVIIFILLLVVIAAATEKLSKARPWEPIVINGWSAREFTGIPVNEIFVFAYDGDRDAWSMIPFQIDERVKLDDPFYENRAPRHFYVQPNTNSFMYSITDTLPAWDVDDELSFMAADMGDRAPDHSWIDNQEAVTHDRLELKFVDPLNSDCEGYAYLYRSSTLTMPDSVATKYGMSFEPYQHIVESNMYSVRLQRQQTSAQNGLLSDVAIKAPFGTGVDFFDIQKLRFQGSINRGSFYLPIGKDGTPAGDEDFLVIYDNEDYMSYTANPVVRVVREVRQTVGGQNSRIDEFSFYVRTKFYPFSGTLEGGASLHSDSLSSELDPGEDYYVELEYIRQSWDLNANAAGMRYYNRYNSGIVVDGNPDQVDTSVDVPISEWNMVSGDQGTFFNYVELEESNWQSVQLYYRDNAAGGVSDDIDAENSDTGDMKSYCDHGLMMHRQTDPGNINLELGFIAYFLPADKDRVFGATLATWIQHPIRSPQHRLVAGVDDVRQSLPNAFRLWQNYPNPFNGTTRIRFALSRPQHLVISVYDLAGKEVVRLADGHFSDGVHELVWAATNSRGENVASGLYVLKLSTTDVVQTRKLVYIR